MGSLFELEAIFTSAPNDPKIILNTKRSKVPHICVNSIHESQILVRFAQRLAVLNYRPLWDKCTEWPKYVLEKYKVKGTP